MPLYPSLAYQASGEGTYSGSLTWTAGTEPFGTTSHQYSWTRIGNRVFMTIFLYFANAGAIVTQVIAALPSDAPTPKQWTGKSAANLSQFPCDVQFFTGDTAAAQAIRTCTLRNNDGLLIQVASGAYKHVLINVEYVV